MTAGAWRIARITLGAGALLVAAPGTNAVSLGAIELRSRMGEPLEARIPLEAQPGEALRGACFSLLAATRGPLAAGGARLELRHHAHGADLYIRSRAPVNDPALAFSIALACPGSQAADPVRYTLALSAAAPAAPPLPVVARLLARSGDTLVSLARAIFPGNAQVRQRYIAALRAENATLGGVADDAPLPEGTSVALPDLRAFAATVPAPQPAERTAVGTTVAAKPPSRLEAKPSSRVARKSMPTRESTAPAHAIRAAHPKIAAGEAGFRLRLSAPVMDLAPSKGMDERRRAELRERLLVLEADDRTAAMLEMRENIRRLESQVNALKLKLATLEAAPVPKAQPVATKPEAPAQKTQPSPPAVEPPKIEPPKIEPPNIEPPNIVMPAPQQPAPGAKAEPAPAAKAARARAPSRSATPGDAPRMPRAPAEGPWYRDRRWLAGLATIFIIAWLALRVRVRSSEEPEIIEAPAGKHDDAPQTAAIPDADAPPTTEPRGIVVAQEPAIATRVPAEDHAELRRRYMEERFPEIVNGALVLEDERSVVKAARLLYEDGTAPRAIELLQFAVEQDPGQLRPWLALFEIFRLEKLEGEFAQLAARLRERHGASEEWRKVRSVGRSLDPANPLYEGTEYGAPVDTEAEGWLRSPSDDAGRALAGELREKLLSAAGVTEADLRADPTPALRKAEIFNLA